MKKIILGLCLLLCAAFAKAQVGLDSIIVEKYYVTTAADAAGAGVGSLPVGSITWRIYADLAPGYKLQAVYGVPTHALTFQTSTTFYNAAGGDAVPNYSKAQLANSANMLDSWLSVGAASTGSGVNKYWGVLKSEDDAVANVVNANGILQNNAPAVGIPLTSRDGLLIGSAGNLAQTSTFVGLDYVPNELNVFNDGSTDGPLFTTTGGSIAFLGSGITGPTATNRVLIAQITTNGVFNYALNLQIGTPTPGVSENWVASSPAVGEFTAPSLSGTLNQPNTLPTVSITAPLNGATYNTGDVVAISANAGDTDGSVAQVEFFVNGVSIGVDNTGPQPYTINWTSTVGNKTLTAVVTDNAGGQTTSTPVSIVVGNNTPPVVSITAPANLFQTTHPASVTITATASDPGGSITSVEFFVNGISIGTSSNVSSPYSIVWTSVIGPAILTAKATDNASAQTTSAPVNIEIIDPNALPYKIGGSTNTCVASTFCLPILAVDTVRNVIGYDVVLNYDKVKVRPTGVVTVAPATINPAYTTTANSVDTANGKMLISVYFNSLAPAGLTFFGKGEIFCVQFAKTANFASVDTAVFSIASLQESYPNGVVQKLAEGGKYITYKDSAFTGALRFWYDNSPIVYNPLVPADHLITNIYGNNTSCSSQSVVAVQPNLSGNFLYNINNGPAINIEKDIVAATDVQPVINGFDAFLTRRVLINDASFRPSIYQMIAMDVNTDGVVSAGDLSQINQRTVLMIPEFKQDWNYSVAGLPLGPVSKDWLFIDANTLNTNVGYLISTTYPSDNGVGYSKARVPQISFCKNLPILDYLGCPIINGETYQGVLLGDVNGNFATTIPNAEFRNGSTDAVVFDITGAIIENGHVDVPVSISASKSINSLDFSLKFNEGNLSFNSIVDQTNYLQSLSNYNAADNTLRFTSSSLQNVENNKAIVAVRFDIKGSDFNASDLNSLQGYLNGERVGVDVKGADKTVSIVNITIFPNPASGKVNVTVSESSNVQLMDINGKLVSAETKVNANQTHEINVQGLANGVYMVKVYNDSFVSMKKLVVKK